MGTKPKQQGQQRQLQRYQHNPRQKCSSTILALAPSGPGRAGQVMLSATSFQKTMGRHQDKSGVAYLEARRRDAPQVEKAAALKWDLSSEVVPRAVKVWRVTEEGAVEMVLDSQLVGGAKPARGGEQDRQRAEMGASRAKGEKIVGMTHPLCWGWGGEYRLGTGYDYAEYSPARQVAFERLKVAVRASTPGADGSCEEEKEASNLVGVVAGKRHTLYVAANGLMFSVGENRHWQLGLVSGLTHCVWKGIGEGAALQRLPKQVLPSGDVKVGRDYKMVQVSAADTVSFGREANGQDAAKATEGFLWIKRGVQLLLETMPGNKNLLELECHLTADEHTMHRRHEGHVLAWGWGRRGELGLGEFVTQSPTPRVVKGLLNQPIASVSAGDAHVLAVSLKGQVFTWGQGGDGRLGHGDYRDRWQACLVEALAGEVVSRAAAGRAHSMAVAQPQKVWMWGRGAHGRLGTGDVHNRYCPVRIKQWPPAFRHGKYVVKEVALGGAHSLLLAHKTVPIHMGNPHGKISVVLAWGFGSHGQLGVDHFVDEALHPLVVPFPKWKLVTHIAADVPPCIFLASTHIARATSPLERTLTGKCHSLACTLDGSLWSWGKGWSGELGLGASEKIRVAPFEVQFPGDRRHIFVNLAGGERHSAALALSCRVDADVTERSASVTSQHIGLAPWESTLLAKWRCPRRPRYRGAGVWDEPMLSCTLCGMDCICRSCARTCHRGHPLRPCKRRLRVLCQCGMQPTTMAGDAHEQDSINCKPVTGCRLLPSVEDDEVAEKDLGLEVGRLQATRETIAITNGQRIARGWLARRRVSNLRRSAACVFQELVNETWYTDTLGTLEKSIRRHIGERERLYEKQLMAGADEESRFYSYYLKLQPVVSWMQEQTMILREISTMNGITVPHPADVVGRPVLSGLIKAREMTLWSTRAMRQYQRCLPPRLRLDDQAIVRRTRNLPRGGRGVGGIPDCDVATLMVSSQACRERFSAEVAAPENLYKRTTRLRAQQAALLRSRRYCSLDRSTGIRKNESKYDEKWRAQLNYYWRGVDNSLGLTRYLQLSAKKLNKLTDSERLDTRKGAMAITRFVGMYTPGSTDPDVMAVRCDGGPRQRRLTLCAPERLNASLLTWNNRLSTVSKVVEDGRRKKNPVGPGHNAVWTSRIEKALCAPLAYPHLPADRDSFLKQSKAIAKAAAKVGYELDSSALESVERALAEERDKERDNAQLESAADISAQLVDDQGVPFIDESLGNPFLA